MTIVRPLLRAALLALVVVTVVASTSEAAPYGPPPERRLGLTVNAGNPGAKVRLKVVGFRPNSRSVVTFESTPVQLATVTADANGAIEADVAIPENAPPGQHTIKVTGVDANGQPFVAASPFVVVGQLPETGSDPQPFVWLGIAALLAGAGVLGVVAYRRRPHA
jgi:LPXTG-motif cell wall-anchored protein